MTPAAAAAALISAPRPAPAPARPAAPVSYTRWADVQQFNLGLRYRYIDNGADVRTNDQD